jgi:hypothetical protein
MTTRSGIVRTFTINRRAGNIPIPTSGQLSFKPPRVKVRELVNPNGGREGQLAMIPNEVETAAGPEDRELSQLLVTGPFEAALRAAIKHRGLSLDRIRYRLTQRNVRVSSAALSHWQSGRSTPERPRSLLALRQLEEVLELPVGSLARLLPYPRPRGRSRIRTALSDDEMWSTYTEDVWFGFDTQWDDALVRVSHHDVIQIGPDRGEHAMRTRQVLRADRDGPDRWILTYRLDNPTPTPPSVSAVRHCRLGRRRYDPRDGYAVADLLFDRPLARGETIMIEYEVSCPPPYIPSTNFERKLRYPVREYTLEIAFHPQQPPSNCRFYSTPAAGAAPTWVIGLEMDPSHCVHMTKLDVSPGCYGVSWDWPS